MLAKMRYASHATMSIMSTENFFASRLGRTATFLALGDEQGKSNLGNVAVEENFGKEVMENIPHDEPRIRFAHTVEDVAESILAIDPEAVPSHIERPLERSAERMVETMFA